MIAYRKYVIIKNSDQLVLSDLPFRPGQRVEVVLIAEDDDRTTRVAQLRELFKTTQALPQAQTLTEEEIAAEIATYRTGQ